MVASSLLILSVHFASASLLLFCCRMISPTPYMASSSTGVWPPRHPLIPCSVATGSSCIWTSSVGCRGVPASVTKNTSSARSGVPSLLFSLPSPTIFFSFSYNCCWIYPHGGCRHGDYGALVTFCYNLAPMSWASKYMHFTALLIQVLHFPFWCTSVLR